MVLYVLWHHFRHACNYVALSDYLTHRYDLIAYLHDSLDRWRARAVHTLRKTCASPNQSWRYTKSVQSQFEAITDHHGQASKWSGRKWLVFCHQSLEEYDRTLWSVGQFRPTVRGEVHVSWEENIIYHHERPRELPGGIHNSSVLFQPASG